MSLNLCMCNRKATSNNPVLALVYSIPASVFISPSGKASAKSKSRGRGGAQKITPVLQASKGTPPVNGHFPLVPRVFAYGRFYCIKLKWSWNHASNLKIFTVLLAKVMSRHIQMKMPVYHQSLSRHLPFRLDCLINFWHTLLMRSTENRHTLPSFKPWRTRYESVNYGISN